MTTTLPNNLENHVTNSSDLGNALQALFQSGGNGTPCSMHIDDLLEIAESMNIDSMIGVLKILSILGVIVVEEDSRVVRTSGKYARFVLGSLSEFLLHSIPLAAHPDVDNDEERYMTQLTDAMETRRRDKIGMTPLYSVDIVNVIIKGKQIRKFREQEVYLHVYHPKWKAYHLIGLGNRGGRSTEELAVRAMEVKLKLVPHQFTFDPTLNPEPIEFVDISGSHGMLTKYTIKSKVIKAFSVDLNTHIKSLVDKPNNGIHEATFRWFTIEEIERCVSDDQESIMSSTPRLLQQVNQTVIEPAAGKVDHLHKSISIRNEIGNRINLKTIAVFGGLALIFFIFYIIQSKFTIFSSSIPILENIANISDILALALAIIALIIGVRKAT